MLVVTKSEVTLSNSRKELADCEWLLPTHLELTEVLSQLHSHLVRIREDLCALNKHLFSTKAMRPTLTALRSQSCRKPIILNDLLQQLQPAAVSWLCCSIETWTNPTCLGNFQAPATAA